MGNRTIGEALSGTEQQLSCLDSLLDTYRDQGIKIDIAELRPIVAAVRMELNMRYRRTANLNKTRIKRRMTKRGESLTFRFLFGE